MELSSQMSLRPCFYDTANPGFGQEASDQNHPSHTTQSTDLAQTRTVNLNLLRWKSEL